MKNARPTDDISRARCNAEGQSGQVGELLRSTYLVVMVLVRILVILMMRMMIGKRKRLNHNSIGELIVLFAANAFFLHVAHLL